MFEFVIRSKNAPYLETEVNLITKKTFEKKCTPLNIKDIINLRYESGFFFFYARAFIFFSINSIEARKKSIKKCNRVINWSVILSFLMHLIFINDWQNETQKKNWKIVIRGNLKSHKISIKMALKSFEMIQKITFYHNFQFRWRWKCSQFDSASFG